MIAGSLGKRVADSEGAGGLKGLQEVGRKKDNGRSKRRGKDRWTVSRVLIGLL